MKYLVVGLGNPGAEYAHTRHNIGFDVLDYTAAHIEAFFSSERYGHIARIKIRGKQVILLKPNTFMNLSGKAVNYWLQIEHIPIENMLVITDDIALPSGTIRIRLKGSDGGHNGLKSINETMNTTNYARLRFGVGNNFFKGQQADYVLSKWPEEEMKLVAERIALSSDAIRTFIAAGPVLAMNQFNTKQ
ncbi:MAG: aminoacyl-tRNA hydrolase [Bacteroidetes bacterium]|nr:aminoacyl-tRNA hydrolase [Bacteroidota bacterium]